MQRYYLRQRQRGEQVDGEPCLHVATGNLLRVHDEFAAAKDPGLPRNERSTKLVDDVKGVEEVGDGTKDGDGDPEPHVNIEAGGVGVDGGEEEVERIEEESDEAGDKEELVPKENYVAARV